jgi:hypothetical protein
MAKANIDLKDILPLLKKINILGFLKNNRALLVPIIIVVLAILLFVPTTLLSRSLRKTIETKSVKAGQDIDRLIRDVNQAAEAEALGPYINAYAQDANAFDNLIQQTTLRELLSYKIFSDPNNISQLAFDPFRQGYVSGIEAMLLSLKAGLPPTETEIYAALETSSRSPYGRAGRPGAGRAPTAGGAYGGGYGRLGGMGGMGGMGGLRMNFRMMTENDRRIVEEVCADKARNAKIYANPVDIGGYAYWSDWKFEKLDKAIKDAWYWQIAYWILEDVAATIQQMNQDAENVLTSPVKRVMSVQFTQSRTGRSMLGRGRRMMNVPKDKQTPSYATGIRNAMTGTPCTGRFTDGVRDIMQFEVRVIVKSAEAMRFLQELCSAKTHKFRGWLGDQPEQTYKHNQISILESQISPVDREDFEHSSFQYGDEEVVDVDLICEYALVRAAYASLFPKEVLDDIEASKTAASTPRR